MGSDQLRKWKPIEGIPDILYSEGIHDGIEGARVLLKGDTLSSRTLKISFGFVQAIRIIDRACLRLINPEICKLKILGESTLFIVENSSWLEWFHKESLGVFEDRGEALVHYAVYTPNECLDILSIIEPDVKWLN